MRIEPTLNTVERTLFLLQLEPFRSLNGDEVAALAAKMTELRFGPGEVIFTEEDPEGRFYVVVDGAAEQSRGEVPIRRATKAMAFGMFGLMGIPDDQTVRAVEQTHLLALAREDFIEAVSDNPAFAVGCLRGLALNIQEMGRRIEALEKALATVPASTHGALLPDPEALA
jgi:CRP-like cAMP-binding protein